MFLPVEGMRAVGRIREMPPQFTMEDAARLAQERVHKAMTAWLPGMVFDRAKLLADLRSVRGSGVQEIERLTALGWLHWLTEDPAGAEALFREACERCQQANNTDFLALAGYWRARVRLLENKTDAMAEYESVLRILKGSPQGTAWFVDLLWRSGRVDRAEQVWKSVRSNKKVMGCDEGPLLEARALLRRGELPAADQLLTEACPGNGVVAVELLLLRAWIAVALQQPQRVDALLNQAQKGPYPASALLRWRKLLEWRVTGTEPFEHAQLLSLLLRDLIDGQQARLAGNRDQAIAALQKARSVPAVELFARYALACLGLDDFAAVGSGQAGPFLAVRCRIRQAQERFRTRQAPPGELLDALQQAGSVGFENTATDHFRRMALLLQRREPHLDDLRSAVSGSESDAVQRRNLFRAAVEAVARRLAPETQRSLLVEWAQLPWLANEGELAKLLARPLLRLVLRLRQTEGPESSALQRLQLNEPLLELLRDGAPSLAAPVPPAVELWQAARQLKDHAFSDDSRREAWRQRVQTAGQGQWRGIGQVLLVQEAAQCGDVAGLAALLEDADAWRGFRPGPPRVVLRLVANQVARQPGHPAWKRCLPGWLQIWGLEAMGPDGKTLAVQAGVINVPGSQTEPPPGLSPVPWFLHLASRAQERGNSLEALACIRRALAADPQGEILARATVVREALPELERRSLAASLAAAIRPDDGAEPTMAAQLVDAVDLVRELPSGEELLHSLQPGLVNLLDRPDLPCRLLHHLALLQLRAADWLEEHDRTDQAQAYWRRSWQAWLRWLALASKQQDIAAEQIKPLLDYLLGLHRQRVNHLLARNEIDLARRHWNLVHELPAQATPLNESLGKDLADWLVRFRDDLADEYLITTREAMRLGEIGEGMNADYEKGLTLLRRLLSLDKENIRLLTALVETCGEYFLDLYHVDSPAKLGEQVDRFGPFALQLARLIENQPAALSARAALADFFKYRGFVARDREQKRSLYRDALRFNPANENVKKLLDDLENPPEEK